MGSDPQAVLATGWATCGGGRSRGSRSSIRSTSPTASRGSSELERRRGRRPARLEELREAGLWGGPLVDAAGTPFGYDAREGRVFIDRMSPMWRPE